VAKYCKMIDVAVLLNPPGDSQEDDRKADIEVYLPDDDRGECDSVSSYCKIVAKEDIKARDSCAR
jgi:hypothetical protein